MSNGKIWKQHPVSSEVQLTEGLQVLWPDSGHIGQKTKIDYYFGMIYVSGIKTQCGQHTQPVWWSVLQVQLPGCFPLKCKHPGPLQPIMVGSMSPISAVKFSYSAGVQTATIRFTTEPRCFDSTAHLRLDWVVFSMLNLPVSNLMFYALYVNRYLSAAGFARSEH